MKQFNRLTLCILTIFFILIIAITPINSQARNYLYKTESFLRISANPTDLGLVEPEGDIVTSEIKITYEYERFARPQGFPIPSRKMPTIINLTVDNKPDWCNVELEQTQFEVEIEKFLQGKVVNLTTNLKAQINQTSAPAFFNGKITIEAIAEENGNINSAYSTLDVQITPDFYPDINYYLSNTSYTIKSGENQNFNIIIENKGNKKISAKINSDIVDSKNFTVELPIEKTIDIDDNESFTVKIKTKDSIDEVTENIVFTITYHAATDDTATGTPVNIPLSVEIIEGDDSSESKIDLVPYVVGIFVVFIILYLIFTLISWRRR